MLALSLSSYYLLLTRLCWEKMLVDEGLLYEQEDLNTGSRSHAKARCNEAGIYNLSPPI